MRARILTLLYLFTCGRAGGPSEEEGSAPPAPSWQRECFTDAEAYPWLCEEAGTESDGGSVLIGPPDNPGGRGSPQ
jgi:hypothetical protein